MTKRETLELIRSLVADEEQQQVKRLAEKEQTLAAERSKLEMLEQFRRDYETRYRDALAAGKPFALVENLRLFLQRLDEAIALEREAVERAAALRAEQEARWQAAYRKRRAFDRLLELHNEAERQELEKKAQKLLDEWVTQRSARRLQGEEG